MSEDPRLYQIAITMINGVGDVIARQLIDAFGSPEAVFAESPRALEKISGIGKILSAEISNPAVLKRAAKELEFVIKNNISTFFFTDDNYPYRLSECSDAPLLLYYKGNANLNAAKCISIVGTRNITDYGQCVINKFLNELSDLIPDLIVVSGLAYGVDIKAHREALRNGLPTVAVLAHGLDRIYPYAHRQTAVEMLQNGGLITEFSSATTPDKPNFVRRNRIVAGLSDATIVIESAAKGGSLITANIAFSYCRDVFAFPGRSTDQYSAGCNKIIRQNKASLLTCADDLLEAMRWEVDKPKEIVQQTIPFDEELDDTEKLVVSIIKRQEEAHINQLAREANVSVQDMSVKLFEMEMSGLVRALPGNKYKLN